MSISRSRGRRGITLVEVLVVIAIIVVLIGLALPAVMAAREAASVAQCQNNLHQLGIAFRDYESFHRKMPPYSTGFPPGTPAGNWLFYMLPYIEAAASGKSQPPPLSQCSPCAPPSVVASGLTTDQLTVLRCPSDPSPGPDYWATTNYLANWYALSGGSGGYFAPAQKISSLHNGLTNTVIFAEAYRVCDGLERMSLSSIWYHNFGITQQGKPSDDPSYLPNDYTMFQVRPTVPSSACDRWRTQTPHAAMMVGLADGSVRSVQAGISPQTWKQVLRNSPPGSPLGSDW